MVLFTFLRYYLLLLLAANQEWWLSWLPCRLHSVDTEEFDGEERVESERARQVEASGKAGLMEVDEEVPHSHADTDPADRAHAD